MDDTSARCCSVLCGCIESSDGKLAWQKPYLLYPIVVLKATASSCTPPSYETRFSHGHGIPHGMACAHVVQCVVKRADEALEPLLRRKNYRYGGSRADTTAAQRSPFLPGGCPRGLLRRVYLTRGTRPFATAYGAARTRAPAKREHTRARARRQTGGRAHVHVHAHAHRHAVSR
jgi:hypothetical protein